MEKPKTTMNFFRVFLIPGSHEVSLAADRRDAETIFSGGTSPLRAGTFADRHAEKTEISFIRAVLTILHANISFSRSKGKMKTAGIHRRSMPPGTAEPWAPSSFTAQYPRCRHRRSAHNHTRAACTVPGYPCFPAAASPRAGGVFQPPLHHVCMVHDVMVMPANIVL